MKPLRLNSQLKILSGGLVCSMVMLLMHSMVASAQSLQMPGEESAQRIVITNITIHTIAGDGTIEKGYVAIEHGKITMVGEGEYAQKPDSAEEIVDATGLHVYPGLIGVGTSIGLVEIGAVRATQDMSEVGEMTPEVKAMTAINPDTAVIPVTRANGILTSLVNPSGGIVSGYGSIINLDGWTTEDLELEKRAGLVVRWPRLRPDAFTRTEKDRDAFLERAKDALKRIDDLFDEAEAYLAARGDSSIGQAVDLRLEALGPVIDGTKPIYLFADRAPQIRSAVTWANRRGYHDIVIFGGLEAEECIDLLKEHDIPVVIGSIHRMPGRRDADYDEAFTLAKVLKDAGVRFCISGGLGEASNERNLPYHAAMAAAYGLSPEEAIRSITLSAAEILCIDDRLGSIEVGKDANLILTTGDPLDIRTQTVGATIEGKPVDLGSKHKSLNARLRRRYGLGR